MSQSLDQPKQEAVPLAKAFLLKEMPGRVGKALVVPPDRQGVLLPARGEARLLSPGRHTVLSVFDRLLGKGAGLRAGYVPRRDFYQWLVGANLLSGDDQLIDLALLCRLEIADPVRFFTEGVLPRQEVSEAALDLDEASVRRLAGLARSYTAEDLVHGLPTERLLPAVQAGLAPLLANQGLRSLGVEMLAFQRADDRALIAEKLLALDERLRQVELEKRMMEIENEQQLDEFIRQFDPGLVEETGLRPVPAVALQPASAAQASADQGAAANGSLGGDKEQLPAPVPAAASPRPSPLEMLRGWITLETKKLGGGRRWRIEALFKKAPPQEDKKEDKPGYRQLRRWARTRFWASIALVMLDIFLSWVIVKISQAAAWSSRWEILFVVWAPIVGFAVESILEFVKKREELEEILWTAKGATFLDDLTGNNRLRIDSLVRGQTSRDLLHVKEMLNDLRARLYRAGQVDLALQTKELERKFESSAEKLQDQRFGSAPYLENLNIKGQVWEGQLDYDEQILVISAALTEDGQAVQQSLAQDAFQPEMLARLEGRLDAFMHRFETRSWALKASDQDIQKYRMEEFNL